MSKAGDCSAQKAAEAFINIDNPPPTASFCSRMDNININILLFASHSPLLRLNKLSSLAFTYEVICIQANVEIKCSSNKTEMLVASF
jgi:hypothetical protein